MSSIRDLARPVYSSYPSHANSFLSIPSASSTSIPPTPLLQPLHNASPSPHASRSTNTTTPATVYSSLVHARRLLMPTVRSPRASTGSPVAPAKSPRIKPTTSKRMRSRSASTSAPSPEFGASAKDATYEWFGRNAGFEIVLEQLEIEGFQIYAVEKWVTERKRPVTTLAVYTGDARHKITVTAFSPSAHLNPAEAQAEWDRVLRDLRQAGARPRETEQGTLMVTSLANFRSDYTIVHIPSGFFLEARERLYANINLLRMGCSGRMALTLEEPGDTTKDRFIGMYHMDDKIRTPELFCVTILGLVKLIQAALSLFGMFDVSVEERNGLLCDVTVDGIQRWVGDIGEPAMGVEPTERVADPTVVCALLSQVSVVRNKLYTLGFGQVIPKDPFLDPQRFLQAIANFQASRLFTSPLAPAASTTPQTGGSHSHPHTAFAAHTAAPPAAAAAPLPYLTDDTLAAIDAAYDKSRTTESYKVHRVLLNKLDDSHAMTEATADMSVFIRFVEGRAAKDGVPSLRWLWSGRAEVMGRRGKEREGKERVWSDGEEDEREKGVEGGEEFSTGEENEFKVWSGKRVQRKIESWTGLNRGKKQSADFSARSGHKSGHHGHHQSHGRGPVYDIFQNGSGAQGPVPRVIVSRDPGEDEDILSSGQVSPISETHNLLGVALPTAESSTANLSDYDRRVSEFNHRRPLKAKQFRVTSWSDPRSAKDVLDEDSARTGSTSDILDALRSAHHAREETIKPGEEGLRGRRRVRSYDAGLKRRRSFDDAEKLRYSKMLLMEGMKIDVDLCGQLLIMRRREAHLSGVVSTLEILTSILSRTNARLREDYETHHQTVSDAEARTKVIADVESARGKVDTMMQETHALSYETSQFYVPNLWHAVAPQRHKVLALRQKVFDTGRRAPGAHGRFSRAQWTLDGRARLVDRTGRTPEEAAEEAGMPEAMRDEELEEGEGAAEGEAAPSWLLKMFESWGTRWGAGRKKADPAHAEGKAREGTGSVEAEGRASVEAESDAGLLSAPSTLVSPSPEVSD